MKIPVVLTAIIILILFSIQTSVADKSEKADKIEKPASPYDLTPVYRIGMAFEEKHAFDVYCHIQTEAKGFKYDDEIMPKFKGETKLDFTITEKDKIKIKFTKLTGTPFRAKSRDIENVLLTKIKSLTGEYVVSKYENLSEILEKSAKLEKAIKKSQEKKDQFTEEDLAKYILSRQLSLFKTPKNKVEIGDSWVGEIPSAYVDLYIGKIVNYSLESVKKKGKYYIATIKLYASINSNDTNGRETVSTVCSGTGEIEFDLTNKVVNKINWTLDYSCKSGVLYAQNDIKKLTMSASYKFTDYGSEEIKVEEK